MLGFVDVNCASSPRAYADARDVNRCVQHVQRYVCGGMLYTLY
jgi:hypothetical protein